MRLAEFFCYDLTAEETIPRKSKEYYFAATSQLPLYRTNILGGPSWNTLRNLSSSAGEGRDKDEIPNIEGTIVTNSVILKHKAVWTIGKSEI